MLFSAGLFPSKCRPQAVEARALNTDLNSGANCSSGVVMSVTDARGSNLIGNSTLKWGFWLKCNSFWESVGKTTRVTETGTNPILITSMDRNSRNSSPKKDMLIFGTTLSLTLSRSKARHVLRKLNTKPKMPVTAPTTAITSVIVPLSIVHTNFLAMCSSRISCTVRATMTLWLRLKNDSISCNASDE